MNNTVSFTLLVDGFESAIDFYVNKLGLFDIEYDFGSGASRLVTLRLRNFCNCFVLQLCNAAHDQELSKLTGRQSGHATLLTLPVESIDHIKSRALEGEITIVREYELPFAAFILICDPFGNYIDLRETL